MIPPAEVGGLFEPFHRLSDRTGGDGFGLGLAIVASIAAMHHGTVTAHSRPEGGLRVVFTMPPLTPPGYRSDLRGRPGACPAHMAEENT